MLPSFALDGVHVTCACAAGKGSVAIGCADGTLRIFDAGEGDTTWAIRRLLRCAGAGIAFAMCVVPRSDDLLVLQSLIQASSHGDAAVYPRALSAATAAAPASTASAASSAAAVWLSLGPGGQRAGHAADASCVAACEHSGIVVVACTDRLLLLQSGARNDALGARYDAISGTGRESLHLLCCVPLRMETARVDVCGTLIARIVERGARAGPR
jgi:hypothetical protein